jgi:hypothetical protein
MSYSKDGKLQGKSKKGGWLQPGCADLQPINSMICDKCSLKGDCNVFGEVDNGYYNDVLESHISDTWDDDPFPNLSEEEQEEILGDCDTEKTPTFSICIDWCPVYEHLVKTTEKHIKDKEKGMIKT